MKLKKIVSLALAGILAVSMLTACGDKGSSSSEGTITTPVDTSFAASVNAELSDKQKAIVTFESDAELEAAVKAVADKFDSSVLKTTSSQFVTGTVVNDFLDMLDAKLGINTFDGNNTSEAITKANILVVPGNFTEDGMAKEVASQIGAYIDTTDMPNQSRDTSCRYSYDGAISVVKVESLSGEYSAYVVGVTVTQNITKVAK